MVGSGSTAPNKVAVKGGRWLVVACGGLAVFKTVIDYSRSMIDNRDLIFGLFFYVGGVTIATVIRAIIVYFAVCFVAFAGRIFGLDKLFERHATPIISAIFVGCFLWTAIELFSDALWGSINNVSYYDGGGRILIGVGMAVVAIACFIIYTTLIPKDAET